MPQGFIKAYLHGKAAPPDGLRGKDHSRTNAQGLNLLLSPPFQLLGRYDVVAEIGRGGQSIVYRAHDRSLHRDVAIKLLRDDVRSEQMLARFRLEMDVTAQLEHAHILHVYDTGEYSGLPFIVMELAPGLTLADRLQREGQLPVADALQMAREVGLALAHAHDRGIVHRDVKPDNILLGPGGALLADFGVAQITQADLALRITSTGTAVGTLLYMSPEQLCAEPTIDSRADQYALACVLYEMLAGVRPHVASSFEGLRMLRMSGRHTPLSMHRSSVPPSVERAVDTALAPMSADRFRSMREFLSALGAGSSADFRVIDALLPVQRGASEASGAPIANRPAPGLRRVLAIAGIGLAALVAVAASFWSFAGGRGPLASPDMVVVIEEKPEAGAISTADSSLAAGVATALRAEVRGWQDVFLDDSTGNRDRAAVIIRPIVSTLNDSARIQFDVQNARSGSNFRVERLVSRDEAGAPAALVHILAIESFVRSVDSTLTGATAPGVVTLPARSIRALRSYVLGFRAMRDGLLDTAFVHFSRAAGDAPGFAHAELWAAQSGAWLRPIDAMTWREHANAALRLGKLGVNDSLIGLGLAALSNADFPRACTAFREATAKAPGSFTAWYNLGECQRLDNAVVERQGSAAFRTSHWSALQAYRRALPLAPTANWLGALITPMVRLTYAELSRVRRGRSVVDSTRQFAALVSASGDSLVLVPIAQPVFQTSPAPDSWLPAVRRGQAIAREITEDAVRRWPDAPTLWLQRAFALELSGMVARAPDGGDAASALEHAASSASSTLDQVSIAVARARVALRQTDFRIAGGIARSALVDLPSPDRRVRQGLLPLAALVGQLVEAERLAIPDSHRDPDVPASLADSLAAFSLRASAGACDGLAGARQRLEKMFAEQFTPKERESQRQRLLADPYLFAVPCLGPSLSREFDSSLPLHRIYRALDQGRPAAALALLDTLHRGRRGATRASVTWDAVFSEAWATAQAGDSVNARVQLTEALENIANMSPFTLDQPAQAAGLRRGLALLVALSDSAANPATYQRWSRLSRDLAGKR